MALENLLLVSGKLAQRNGRVRCHEHLKGNILVLGSQGVQQALEPVRLQSKLDLVHKRNGGRLSGLTLQPGHEQARRSRPERTQWNAGLAVQRDRTIAYGYCMRV